MFMFAVTLQSLLAAAAAAADKLTSSAALVSQLAESTLI